MAIVTNMRTTTTICNVLFCSDNLLPWACRFMLVFCMSAACLSIFSVYFFISNNLRASQTCGYWNGVKYCPPVEPKAIMALKYSSNLSSETSSKVPLLTMAVSSFINLSLLFILFSHNAAVEPWPEAIGFELLVLLRGARENAKAKGQAGRRPDGPA